MKILYRLLLSILPPVLSIIVLASIITFQLTDSGVNQQEQDFLNFKARQLESYIISQWNLLIDFKLYYEPDLIRSAQQAVSEYASGLITVRQEAEAAGLISRLIEGREDAAISPELIFALVQNEDFDSALVAFSTNENLSVSPEEGEVLLTLGEEENGVTSFAIAEIGGASYAYSSFLFEPFNWVVYVGESVNTFQRTQSIIRIVSTIVVIIVLTITTLLIVFLSRTITKPLTSMSYSIQEIIKDIPEIKTSVPILYDDESGILAQNFNSVFSALNRNYKQLKQYTYNNIVIQKRETRLKGIFQKYVPQTLIDRYVQRPESLLQSESRDIAVFFMDIRGFTSISEKLSAPEVVKMINAVFTEVVDQVNKHEGHVDKYIGDALMAIFGAPVHSKNDCAGAVNTALSVLELMPKLNASQEFKNYPTVDIGVGIHYGDAVIGNIGCDSKIEYTAIGDTVNAASRVEGLCKVYGQSLIISASVVKNLGKDLMQGWTTRFVDRVAVKGKKQALGLYTVIQTKAYDSNGLSLYNQGVKLYAGKKFDEAITTFKKAAQLIPNDFLIDLFIKRCHELKSAKLPPEWNGVYIATSK